MLFNSLRFLFVFLPITIGGFHVFGRYGRRPVVAWLGFMSLVFYGAWNPVYVLVLLASIVVNYAIAGLIGASPEGSPRRKQLLAAGITLNLLSLFYFKYLFKLLAAFKALHLLPVSLHPILLPLGISFFTFTQISYLIDLAQGQAEVQDFLSYLLFVTFFPHLIAGPILHHKEMMPQFSERSGNSAEHPTPLLHRRFSLHADDVAVGLTWFLMGLSKKVLIADKLAPAADLTFTHAGILSAATAWSGLVAYTMQLYFDFSGYSDMAIGIARIFSIRFPLNFDSPYKAISVTEFWQRWHMTLTRYITLYLYNPILLSVQRRRMEAGRKTNSKALATIGGFTAMVAFPTVATMLLTGIWHGAGLQFVVFGLIHGVYLTANQAWRHFRQRAHRATLAIPPVGATRIAMMLGVYLQVALALIFFRSESVAAAGHLLSDMFGHNGAGTLDQLLARWGAFALFPVVWFCPNTQQILGQETGPGGVLVSPGARVTHTPPAAPLFPWLRWRPNTVWLLVMAAIFFASLANLDPHARFLYFQF